MFWRRRRKFILGCLLIGSFLVLSLLHMRQIESDENKRQSVKNGRSNGDKDIKTNRTSESDFQRLVHLDLKGAPPKISYFEKVFPLFKKWGATGLLVEYEDMFPYDGKLAALPRMHAYTKEEIQQLQALAKFNHLTFIPLVQTFGHLEFVLKHDNFAHLREIPTSNKCIVAGPCNGHAYTVLTEIIRQMMSAHPDVTHMHLGSDEVWQLGQGNECTNYLERERITKPQLFLQHMTFLAAYVKKNYPSVTPIVWDDMFRHTDLQLLMDYGVGDLVEPMVWRYKQDIEDKFDLAFWEKYSKIFKNAWVGSAFKGATGETQPISSIRYYSENVFHWRNIVERAKHLIHFKGLVLTGWSRYNHVKGLCELLPVALPSLAYCLHMSMEGEINHGAASKISNSLGCDSGIVIDPNHDPMDKKIGYTCSFPGFDMYKVMFDYRRLLFYIRRSKTRKSGKPFMLKIPLEEFKKRTQAVGQDIERLLSSYFDEHTVHEWIKQNISPLLLLKHSGKT